LEGDSKHLPGKALRVIDSLCRITAEPVIA